MSAYDEYQEQIPELQQVEVDVAEIDTIPEAIVIIGNCPLDIENLPGSEIDNDYIQ